MRKALDYQLAQRTARPLEALDPRSGPPCASGRISSSTWIGFRHRRSSTTPWRSPSARGKTQRRGHGQRGASRGRARPRATSPGRRRPRWTRSRTRSFASGRGSSSAGWTAMASRRRRAWLALQQPAAALVRWRRIGSSAHANAWPRASRPRAWRPSPRPSAPHGLHVTSGAALATEAFREGWFVVQDEASQLIAELGAMRSGGASWISARRRAGRPWRWPHGATVDSSSRVTCGRDGFACCDKRSRASRCRRPIVQVACAATCRSPPARFDYVLVDAPCSGLGTLRRDPDIRWTRTPTTSSASPRLSSCCCSARRGWSPQAARWSTPPVRASPTKTTRSWRTFSPTPPGFSVAQHDCTGPCRSDGRARSVLRRRARPRTRVGP